MVSNLAWWCILTVTVGVMLSWYSKFWDSLHHFCYHLNGIGFKAKYRENGWKKWNNLTWWCLRPEKLIMNYEKNGSPNHRVAETYIFLMHCAKFCLLWLKKYWLGINSGIMFHFKKGCHSFDNQCPFVTIIQCESLTANQIVVKWLLQIFHIIKPLLVISMFSRGQFWPVAIVVACVCLLYPPVAIVVACVCLLYPPVAIVVACVCLLYPPVAIVVACVCLLYPPVAIVVACVCLLYPPVAIVVACVCLLYPPVAIVVACVCLLYPPVP